MGLLKIIRDNFILGLDFKRIGRVKNDIGGYDHIVRPRTINKSTGTQSVTRGPINWWDEPKYKKQNPNFDPQTYLNNPVGNQFYSRDIPKGMEPRYFEEKKNGGWLNKYK